MVEAAARTQVRARIAQRHDWAEFGYGAPRGGGAAHSPDTPVWEHEVPVGPLLN